MHLFPSTSPLRHILSFLYRGYPVTENQAKDVYKKSPFCFLQSFHDTLDPKENGPSAPTTSKCFSGNNFISQKCVKIVLRYTINSYRMTLEYCFIIRIYIGGHRHSISMSVISDIRHRHLLFQYRR